VRIPSALAEDAHLHEGAEVEVTIREGQLVIVPVLSLAELVAGITASNLPDLDTDDAPRGGELW
jgi:antitoxin component of MazEF toxin-antitoxin module